jgi:RNA polymerase sigma factor (sigma-70 family)
VIAASTSPPARPRLGGVLLRTQPDRRLAQLTAEGSEPAFEEIIRRHRSGLVGFAGAIASRDSADDVVQDSMVKAHAALLRGDRPESVKAWLFAIVRNTALNDRRDRRVHQPLDENHDGVEQPPETVDRRRRFRDLVQALANLPAAQRQAIVRRELEGKGHDEIARELQISAGAVRQLIFRARSALRAGVGCLLPMQLVRAAILSGAADPAGPATSVGMAAKVGVGALVTTGALVAGTNALKHDGTQAQRHPVGSPASVRPQPRVAQAAADRQSVPSATGRRQRVVITPRQVSAASTSAPISHVSARNPQARNPSAGTHSGSQPPPGGGAGPGGAGGGAGDQRSGANPVAQASSAPPTSDCKQDGGRDPVPDGVSPG